MRPNCEHCGKQIASGRLCRRDRRRLKAARDAIMPRVRWYVYPLALIGLVALLFGWDNDDPHW